MNLLPRTRPISAFCRCFFWCNLLPLLIFDSKSKNSKLPTTESVDYDMPDVSNFLNFNIRFFFSG
jgi:hypothetical protein